MNQLDELEKTVVVASDASAFLRASLGIPVNRAPRLALMAGPGDVVGTFDRWTSGCHDDRVPVLTYSAQFYSLASALGADALILTEDDRQPRRPDPRFRFVHVPRNRDARSLAWHLAEWDYARRLAEAVRQWGADVIIVSGDMKPAAYHALSRHGRLILTLHATFWPMGQRPAGLRARLRQASLGRALALADGAVCTSVECARQFEALAGQGRPIEVEMPQLLAAHLHPQRKRQRARNLLFLGRIETNKGVFDLVEAFGALVRQFPDARLTVAGTGSAERSLAETVAQLGLGGHIQIPGLLNAAGVHAALNEADLLICPTRSEVTEGLALVVLEAAAQGVPSLASSVVPAAETAANACLTFPADDVGALQAALAQLMDDEANFAALAAEAAAVRPRMLDRSLGWGSCLGRVMTRQAKKPPE